MIKIAPERIELIVPETLVVRHPLRGILHGSRIDFTAHDAAFFQARDESRGLQHSQMFHEAGQ